jgi:chaperone BCS1
MAKHSMDRILNLARTSLLGGAAGTSIQELLEQSTPGFGFLQDFFAAWLKIDLTTLAAALTIFGTISGALGDLKGVALKIYWWFTRLFTASISIPSSDKLNREILNWVGSEILTRQGTRILTARTEAAQKDAWYSRRSVTTERNDYLQEKRVPIQYLPTFGTTWFFHQGNIFLVRRISPSNFTNLPDEYASAPEGDEPLVVMCLGRSVKPIKSFLDNCRDFAENQRRAFTTVRASKDKYHQETWDTVILRPIRPMETVHFDENTKAELVADIKNYLDPATRKFYTARGIPYRRGYLLHGPPGTGKTSLSLALAGVFALDLYLLHLPSVREDTELEKLFTALPPRCIVLVEDIDAVGIKRRPEIIADEEEESEDEDNRTFQPSRCTLSGLLNVLDGVASQEGRIVLMTSNFAEKLDKALVRPGRIDSMIFLGNISKRSAELMFLRMYTPDPTQTTTIPGVNLDMKEGELEKLALKFSKQIPDNAFTPAQLQGYLLNHRSSPAGAVTETAAWVEDERVKKEEAKKRAKQAREYRAKKRKEAAFKMLAKNLANGNIDPEQITEGVKEGEGAKGEGIPKGEENGEGKKSEEKQAEEKQVDAGPKTEISMETPPSDADKAIDASRKEKKSEEKLKNGVATEN